VTALYDVLKANTNDATKLALIEDLDQVLGLDLIAKASAKREELQKTESAKAASEFSIVSESGEVDADISAKIEARRAAKKAKDFSEADRIRNELKAQGIELTDIPNGVVWKRV
jgi:cysteinyl-tRNA synthetase